MNNYVVKAVFSGSGARPMYISSLTSLSSKRKEALLFASEKECEEAAAQPCFETAGSFEFIPVPKKGDV